MVSEYNLLWLDLKILAFQACFPQLLVERINQILSNDFCHSWLLHCPPPLHMPVSLSPKSHTLWYAQPRIDFITILILIFQSKFNSFRHLFQIGYLKSAFHCICNIFATVFAQLHQGECVRAVGQRKEYSCSYARAIFFTFNCIF